jgi:MFS transporter, DHA2 family, methylenomycin A resistance protein
VLSGRLTGHHGPRSPMVAGYGFTGIGLLGMCVFEPHTSDLIVGLVFAVTGVGMGLALPATNASAFIAVPRQRSGIASATVNATRQTGTALGVAVLGGLISVGAIPVASEALGRAGSAVSMQRSVAEYIVLHHGVVASDSGWPLSPAMAADIFAQAFSSGFHISVLMAAGVSLLAAALVLRTRW